jgi:shikimate dehydrogenase
MTDFPKLSGETRAYVIVGDPIAQVKSPALLTRAMATAGCNAVLLPMHVTSGDIDAFIDAVALARNLDGIVITVPHKFAAFRHCATTTARARRLGVANMMRRNSDGSWHGDMCDGQGFVDGARAAGCRAAGARALLVGAGGAGSAIALALLEAGVSELAIHDTDITRRDALLARVHEAGGTALLHAGSPDPTGYAVIANATPMGMRASDPPPVTLEHITGAMFVGDVVTTPEPTPLIAAARRAGCNTNDGAGMFAAQIDLMCGFLLAAWTK